MNRQEHLCGYASFVKFRPYTELQGFGRYG